MDPYDLMDPVDILSKLPKDYYEQVVGVALDIDCLRKQSSFVCGFKLSLRFSVCRRLRSGRNEKRRWKLCRN